MEYHYILMYQQYSLKLLRARAWVLSLSCDCPCCLIASQLLDAGFVSVTSSDPMQCPDTVLRVSVSWEVFLVGAVDNTVLEQG